MTCSYSFVLTSEVTWQRHKLLLVQNFINSSRWTSLSDVSLTHTRQISSKSSPQSLANDHENHVHATRQRHLMLSSSKPHPHLFQLHHLFLSTCLMTAAVRHTVIKALPPSAVAPRQMQLNTFCRRACLAPCYYHVSIWKTSIYVWMRACALFCFKDAAQKHITTFFCSFCVWALIFPISSYCQAEFIFSPFLMI